MTSGAPSHLEAERLDRNKRIAWSHFLALAEGRLADCLANVDGNGVFWRNAAFDGKRPSVPLQLWKDMAAAIIERRLPIPWQAGRVHLVNIFAEGDQVVLEIHNDSIPYHEGLHADSFDMVYLFTVTVRDGKIVGIREYPDGFLMDIMLTKGTASRNWWDLAEARGTPDRRPEGACAGCGMIHVDALPSVAGLSPARQQALRNKQIAWDHFRAVDENRVDDAVAGLGTDGAFWAGARFGDKPRRGTSIMSWHRELDAIVANRLPMPWTGGVHLINAVAEGDQVLLELHNTSLWHEKWPLPGQYDMIYAWVLTMRDGKIVEVREYPDGIYGAYFLTAAFKSDAVLSPVTMLGALPSYAPEPGSCLSCDKVHHSSVDAFKR